MNTTKVALYGNTLKSKCSRLTHTVIRLFALVATIAIFSTLFLILGAKPALAVDAATLADQINNHDHGGNGTLTATAYPSNHSVYVTGSVTGMTNGFSFDLESNLTLAWGADCSGEGASIFLKGDGIFYLDYSGRLDLIGQGPSHSAAITVDSAKYVDLNGTITVSSPVQSIGVDATYSTAEIRVWNATIMASGSGVKNIGVYSKNVSIGGGAVVMAEGATNNYAFYDDSAADAISTTSYFLVGAGTTLTAPFHKITPVFTPTPGVVKAGGYAVWNPTSKIYLAGSTDDLVSNPANSAKWSRENGNSGIKYSVAPYYGFISVPGVSVFDLPSAPINLKAVPSDGEVTLTWDAPADDGGTPITKYSVSTSAGNTWVDVLGTTSFTFTGLTNGSSYDFSVKAFNMVGNSDSAIVSATPSAGTPLPSPNDNNQNNKSSNTNNSASSSEVIPKAGSDITLPAVVVICGSLGAILLMPYIGRARQRRKSSLR